LSKSDKTKRTEAKRLKRRVLKINIAGRDRKSDRPRMPSGERSRLKPSERAEDILAVAKNQPHRVNGLNPLDKGHGSIIGKMMFAREVSAVQVKAAERYAGLRQMYLSAIGAQPENAQAMNFGGAGVSMKWAGETAGMTDAEKCATIRHAYGDAVAAMQEAGVSVYGAVNRNRIAEALRVCVMENRGADVGDVRLALNALVRLWKMADDIDNSAWWPHT
jgi:hypothetical protein